MRTSIALAFLSLPSLVFAQRTPIPIEYARSYFAELEDIGRADGGRMWGRPLHGPMLFVDPVTRTLVANMPDAEGRFRATDGVWTGTLPIAMNAANTAIDLGGRRWSMVMWPVTDSRYARSRLLIHESFHRIQPELGMATADRPNAHLGTAEGRIWTRLEWRALTEALLRDGAKRRQALRDALVFRARRHSFAADGAEDERLLELNEGLAEYTGFALSGLPQSALHDRVAVQLAQYEAQDNFARSFAYVSGPAYALLLDASGREWRSRIRASSSLSAMAAAAYRIAVADPKTAGALTERYGARRMIADERARETERAETERGLRALFVDGPTLTLPVAGKFNFSFDPNGATPIQGIGTVYESSRITDEWGVLEVSSGGVLMRRANGSITSVVVPAPAPGSNQFKGAGWGLTLAAGWSLRPGARQGDWTVVDAAGAEKKWFRRSIPDSTGHHAFLTPFQHLQGAAQCRHRVA